MKVAGIAVVVALVGVLASGAVMADGKVLLHHCQSALQDLDGMIRTAPITVKAIALESSTV
jgi:hypothetical protein